MTDPVKKQIEVPRFPLRNRPVPDRGTTLVYHMPNEEFIAPSSPFTYGELWWRKPRLCYMVDTSKHHDSFGGKLPSNSSVLDFRFAVGYEWRVERPEAVVREAVADVPSICRRRLQSELSAVTGGYAPLDARTAGNALNAAFGAKEIPLDEGVRIFGIEVKLSIPPEQEETATQLAVIGLQQQLAAAQQDGRLKMTEKEVTHLQGLLERGDDAAIAIVLAGINEHAQDAATLKLGQSREERQSVIELWEVFVKSGLYRPSDVEEVLDGANKLLKDKFGLMGGERKSLDGSSAHRSLEPGEDDRADDENGG